MLAEQQKVLQDHHGRTRADQLFDQEAFIHQHKLDLSGPEPWIYKAGSQGQRWTFNVCPWSSDHADQSAYIVQFTNGAIAAGCHHNGCFVKNWHALRDLKEPGWRERQQGSVSFVSGVPPRSEKNWP